MYIKLKIGSIISLVSMLISHEVCIEQVRFTYGNTSNVAAG